MLSPDSTCPTILSAVSLRRRLLTGVRLTAFLFNISLFFLVFSSTLRRLRFVDSSVCEVSVCKAWGARSIETVLFTPYLSRTKECKFSTIMQNGQRLLGISLLYNAAEILSTTLVFVTDKEVLPMKTKTFG